jgi:hypothetical protein
MIVHKVEIDDSLLLGCATREHKHLSIEEQRQTQLGIKPVGWVRLLGVERPLSRYMIHAINEAN